VELFAHQTSGVEATVEDDRLEGKRRVKGADVAVVRLEVAEEDLLESEGDRLGAESEILVLGKHLRDVLPVDVGGALERHVLDSELRELSRIARAGVPAYLVATRSEVDGQARERVEVSIGGQGSEEELHGASFDATSS
jgi:hypothetical protein